MRESRVIEMKSQKTATPNKALEHAIIDSRWSTQRELAKRLPFDETRLSRIVNGKARVSPDERRALAKALRRPQRELFPHLFPAKSVAA